MKYTKHIQAQLPCLLVLFIGLFAEICLAGTPSTESANLLGYTLEGMTQKGYITSLIINNPQDRRLAEGLSCPVCKLIFQKRLGITPCAHTICGGCEERVSYCPQCRATIEKAFYDPYTSEWLGEQQAKCDEAKCQYQGLFSEMDTHYRNDHPRKKMTRAGTSHKYRVAHISELLNGVSPSSHTTDSVLRMFDIATTSTHRLLTSILPETDEDRRENLLPRYTCLDIALGILLLSQEVVINNRKIFFLSHGCRKLNISSKTGNIRFKTHGSEVNTPTILCSSLDCYLEGSFGSVCSVSTISGDITISLPFHSPVNISVQTTTGNIEGEIAIPGNLSTVEGTIDVEIKKSINVEVTKSDSATLDNGNYILRDSLLERHSFLGTIMNCLLTPVLIPFFLFKQYLTPEREREHINAFACPETPAGSKMLGLNSKNGGIHFRYVAPIE